MTTIKSITSASNPLIKTAKKLASSNRHCRIEGKTLAEGIHLAQELTHRSELVNHVFVTEQALNNSEIAELVDRFLNLDKEVLQLPNGLYQSISPVETSTGILCEISIPEEKTIPNDCDVVFLDGVQDPGNLGTILRTALAADVSVIVMGPDSVYPWSAKALRAGMGAHFYTRIVSGVTLESLKENGRRQCLVADARGGKNLYIEQWGDKPTVWVFGSEGQGVSEQSLAQSDKTLLIPINPQMESLNVAVAATVCLFEQKRRRLQ